MKRWPLEYAVWLFAIVGVAGGATMLIIAALEVGRTYFGG